MYIKNQSLYFGAETGVISLDIDTGNVNWYRETGFEGYQLHKLRINANGYLIGGYQHLSNKDIVEVIDLDGNRLWSTLDQPLISVDFLFDFVDMNDRLITLDRKGIIHVLNLTDGSFDSSHALNQWDLNSHVELYQENNIAQTSISLIKGKNNEIYIYTSAKIKNDLNMLCINYKGQILYKKRSTDGEFHIIRASDSYGNAFYNKNNSDLAGSQNIVALNALGHIVDKVSIGESSTSNVEEINIYDDILLAAISHEARLLFVKLNRGPEAKVKDIHEIQPINSPVTLGVNLKESVPFVVKAADGSPILADKYTWESLDTSKAEVINKHVIVGKENSTVPFKLTVEANGKTHSKILNITFIRKAPQVSSVEIKVDDPLYALEKLEIEYGKPVQFSALVKDQYGQVMENEIVQWSSVMNFGSRINDQGVFLSKVEGSFNLEVKVNSNVNITTSVSGKVYKKPPKYTSLYPVDIYIRENTLSDIKLRDQYGAEIDINKLPDKHRFEWRIDDTDIALIENHKIKGKKIGTSKIIGILTDESNNKIQHTATVHVIPSFGLGPTALTSMPKKIATDGISLFAFEDSTFIKALDSNLKVKWFQQKYPNGRELVANDLCLVALFNNGKKDSLVRLDKTTGDSLWDKSLDRTYEFLKINSNTIYVWGLNRISAFNLSGDLLFDETLEGNILDLKFNNNQANVLIKVNDALKNLNISLNGDIRRKVIIEDFDGEAIDINGLNSNTWLLHHNIGDNNKVVFIKDNVEKWHYEMPEDAGKIINGLVIGDNIYFVAGANFENGYLICLSKDGDEVWKNYLSDFSSIGNRVPEYLYAYNNLLYLGMTEKIKVGWNFENSKSYFQEISPIDGSVNKELNLLYNEFGHLRRIYTLKNALFMTTYDYHNKNGKIININKGDDIHHVPTKIAVTNFRPSIISDDTYQLNHKVTDEVGIIYDNEKVIWTSEDPSILSIDENGLIRGMSPGDTYVKATLESNKDVYKKLNITVLKAGAFRLSTDHIKAKMKKTIDFYQKKGLPESDWVAIALNAAGEDLSLSKYSLNDKTYLDVLEKEVMVNPKLGLLTNYARKSIAILSCKADPSAFVNANLIEEIYKFPNFNQGNNAPIWALIALNANGTRDDASKKNNKDFLINYLLSHKAGKGWTWAGTGADCDMTGMAIYALAPYYNTRQDVKNSVDEAVAWLKSVQHTNGSFSPSGANKTSGDVNTESTA